MPTRRELVKGLIAVLGLGAAAKTATSGGITAPVMLTPDYEWPLTEQKLIKAIHDARVDRGITVTDVSIDTRSAQDYMEFAAADRRYKVAERAVDPPWSEQLLASVKTPGGMIQLHVVNTPEPLLRLYGVKQYSG